MLLVRFCFPLQAQSGTTLHNATKINMGIKSDDGIREKHVDMTDSAKWQLFNSFALIHKQIN